MSASPVAPPATDPVPYDAADLASGSTRRTAGQAERRDAVRTMLEARTIALVGATPRRGGLAERLMIELERSPSRPTVHLVNPRYDSIGSRRCFSSLSEIAGPVDLVAMAVPDGALVEQLSMAASRGDRSAVIYGSAIDAPRRAGVDGTVPTETEPTGTKPTGTKATATERNGTEPTKSLRTRLASIAESAGMAVCGAGCMGFVNPSSGLRAVGYLEPDPLPSGPVALVTHSGSAFSALLRADRRLGWTVAVSSGQELITTTADYINYALELAGTRVIGLLLETFRHPDELRASLLRAAEADVVVVALTVGASPGGRAMVAAHSGALAGDDATWEALCRSTGLLRVNDLSGLADTLELFAAGRRSPRPSVTETGAPASRGIASVHDSGAERALVVDVAHSVGVSFAEIGDLTRERLAGLLDPGLEATNPLDVWGTGAATRELFGGSLSILASDPSVDAVVLCVDLVTEFDGDTGYADAVIDAWATTTTPLCVMSNLPSSIDRVTARQLREAGVPGLEGTASGLVALGHLIGLDQRRADVSPRGVPIDLKRQQRWLGRLSDGPLDAIAGFSLLADYGIHSPMQRRAATEAEALIAADTVGYPVVLKTARHEIGHKSDVGGVMLGLDSPQLCDVATRR